MRQILLSTLIVLGTVTAAAAQPASRFEIGPVMRLDHVYVEGGASGRTTVAGLATTFKITKAYAVEVEVTQATNRIERSYQGTFVSYYPGTDSSRENFERFAPVARRSLGYAPGLGWATAFVARGDITPRVSIAARAGLSARKYRETSDMTVLSIPAEVDPQRVARDSVFQDASFSRTRGGLLFGLDTSIAITEHLSISPELRFVYGGPAQIGNTHREAGFGARATWRF